MPREHTRARRYPGENEDGEHDGHAAAAGDAEDHGGDEHAAVHRVVGGIGCDNAANVAFAEGLGAALLGLARLSVGNPVGRAAADARHDAHENADEGGSDHQPLVVPGLPHAAPHVRLGVAQQGVQPLPGDGGVPHHQGDCLGQREKTHHHGHEPEPVPQVEVEPHGGAHVAAQVGVAHHGDGEAEGRGEDALDEGAGADHGHGHHPHQRQQKELGRTEPLQ